MSRAGRLGAAVVTAAFGFGLLAGCNSGGDTSCGDYNSASVSDRIDIVKKVLSAEGKSTGMLHVDADRAVVAAYCASHPGSDPIKNAVGG